MPKSIHIIHQMAIQQKKKQAIGLASSPSNLQSLQMMSTGIATSSPMSAPPRKVSFEDGHSDDNASACSESSSEQGSTVLFPLHQEQQQQQHQLGGEETKEVRLSRSKSSHKHRLLARHSPSLSLVDLARTIAMEDDPNNSNSNSTGVQVSQKKRPHSAPVSPITGVNVDPSRCLVANLLPPGMESPAEPWGHFVDMALPEKKKLRSVPKTIPLTARAATKSTARKRQTRRKFANPYGEYHHTKLCFQPSTSKSMSSLSVLLPSSESLFRLKPLGVNKEPTEQIAGDLERLHFDGF
jgi:hypothetical protein